MKRDMATVTAYRRPMGYQQLTNAQLQASIGLTLPANAGLLGVGFAMVQCQGGTVRWRDDGTAPTAAIGMTIASGGELDYVGEMSAIRFITASGTPIVDISYYE